MKKFRGMLTALVVFGLAVLGYGLVLIGLSKMVEAVR